MNLNQLHYFAKLAEVEHYTKAAEELSISQPSLSHAVSSLEKEIGTKLFEKQGRGVVLTKYGKIFKEYVDEAIHSLDTGVKKVQSMTGQTEGVVELAYIYTLGSGFVPRLVGDFLRTHEELKVKFRFTVGNTSEIIQGLKEDRFDIGFCSMAEREGEIGFTPVGREKLVVVVPKGHPLSYERAVDLEQAAAYPQIFYTPNSGLRPVVDRMFEQAKLNPKIAYEIEQVNNLRKNILINTVNRLLMKLKKTVLWQDLWQRISGLPLCRRSPSYPSWTWMLFLCVTRISNAIFIWHRGRKSTIHRWYKSLQSM